MGIDGGKEGEYYHKKSAIRCVKQLMTRNVDMREYYVYILASKRNGTLYSGMTNDLAKRVKSHKNGSGSKFVKKYKVHLLVYFEKVIGYLAARKREKQLKWWKRKWKLALIEQMNPKWRDLSIELLGPR